KLLRVLQEQRFERLGGNETVETDVRIIAATNADLEKRVAAGRFRQDLYFRFNVFPIHLPPLRERGDDLQLLVDYHLRRFGYELDKPIPAVPPETQEVFRRYDWPGNVRELQSALKQSLLQMRGSVLLPEFLPGAVREPAGPADGAGGEFDRFVQDRIAPGSEALYAKSPPQMERRRRTPCLHPPAGTQ